MRSKPSRPVLRFVMVLAVGLLTRSADPAAGQGYIELVGPIAQIPRDSYKTWSLFLVCNPDWVAPENSAGLAPLPRIRRRRSSWLTTTDHQDGNTLTYVQVFRTGALEAADRFMLGYAENQEQRYIPGAYFERTIASSMSPYLAVMGELGIQPPVFLGLSLLGVKGYQMGVEDQWSFARAPRHIERQDLVLPEIAIDDLAVDPYRLLKPIFDIVWNAAGWPGSLNYSPEGEWKGR